MLSPGRVPKVLFSWDNREPRHCPPGSRPLFDLLFELLNPCGGEGTKTTCIKTLSRAELPGIDSPRAGLGVRRIEMWLVAAPGYRWCPAIFGQWFVQIYMSGCVFPCLSAGKAKWLHPYSRCWSGAAGGLT